MISGLHHLDSWLDRSTWYTLHPDEEKLFYLALKKVIAENPGVLIHEQYVRDYILSKKVSTLADGTLIPTAQKYGQLAENISDYLLNTQ
ncbi:hypothetical protein RAH17_17000 [Klebsiella pneumoniae]|uniref:hypothetical protein n=1 Tax=Klebsiella pneumoniae complex TaxID=3390273 RepID=UPI000A268B19|nr:MULTISPECIES: hypothetical protein [Klebsiella]EKW1758156.1 hypothetical protein [Klebsiella pneumoniae]MDK6849463.1 hypothetical protein [Klebsiella quasipneumoniae]MDK7891283.1 hypothetical protein [Klebsiella quasipneumoniae]MDK8571186.1 hypothetical protein [Klebsiella quasipneumoniae]SXZ76652.1 Uncharacterised protein [Klebsiella pneumoniae]